MIVQLQRGNAAIKTGMMVARAAISEGRVEEHGLRRKLTTILSADCAGYSRLMRSDEEGTYRTLHACRQLIDRFISEHEGRIFGSAGDSIVAEFPSPVEAVRAALDIQQAIAAFGHEVAEDHRMLFRIGINLGDVLIDGDDLLGDGVNIAARLQGLAEPGGICVSGSVYEQVRTKLALASDDLGNQTVKNIADPVHAFRVRPREAATAHSAVTGPVNRRSIALIPTGAVAVLGIVVLAAYLHWQSTPAPECSHASIAVLPLANLSGDASQEYFSDGTTEDITSALERFSDLTVIANVAVQQYKGRPVHAREINRDLKVCYVLTGSVRRSGDQVLVTAQLNDALSEQQLWSDEYSGVLKDLFEMRNQITLSVAGKLAIKMQDLETQRAVKKPTENLDAYDLVLRARAALDQPARAANIESRQLFQQAIDRDPALASAYAGVGWTRYRAATYGWTELRNEALKQAAAYAQKAVELDKESAEAHRLLALVFLADRQFQLAASEIDQAIALNPNDAESYSARGTFLLFTGDPGQSLGPFELAMRLNPNLGPNHYGDLGWAYYLVQRYEDAVTMFTKAEHMDSNDYSIHAGLAAAYAQVGRKDEAVRAAADVMRTWPFFGISQFVRDFQGTGYQAAISDGLRKAGLR
jgi:class 3 adenylate cyclase/TolB-like protein